MNIGIDMDGVVFDTERLFYKYAVEFDKKIGGTGIKHIDELKAKARYEWTKEQSILYGEECCIACEKLAGFMDGVIETLNKLKREGHTLVGITARGLLFEEEIEITVEKLKNANLKFDKIFFKQSSKVNACIENKIDVMIDDYYKLLTEISQIGIPCIYFKWRDNLKKSDNPLVTSVGSWNEVYEVIKNIQKKLKAQTFSFIYSFYDL